MNKDTSILEEIITSSNVVFKDFVSAVMVEIRKLGTTTRMTADNNATV